jgi:WD40 repeat protein
MSEPLVSPADPGTIDADNPWPGLAAFREADKDFFFGREEETEELLRLVQRERLTVLFGLSGLGKTSLLQAGLFPRLRGEDVLPVPIRLDFSEGHRDLIDQVRGAIAAAAAAARVEAPPLPQTETLWESLHRKEAEFWGPRTRLNIPLLVFDQFEEIFTLGRRSADQSRETDELLAELAALAEGAPPPAFRARAEADPSITRELSLTRHPYKILFSLREDFLADLDSLRGQFRSVFHNRMRLRQMNGESALRVVAQPGPLLIVPEVAERVVRFVAGQEEKNRDLPLPELEVEPALLSFVCRELNRQRGGAPISADLLQGNREEIFSKFYEDSVRDQAPQVRTFIEDHLLTKSGFRNSVALDNAVDVPGVTREALDQLIERRLLRIEEHGGRLELTHDVLTGVIKTSRDTRRQREDRAKAEAARREAEERERQVRHQLRRSRWVGAWLSTLVLALIVFMVWGYLQNRRARQALASSYFEKASSLQESRPFEALAYLAGALRQDSRNLPAQSLLTDNLLYRSWPFLVAERRPPSGQRVVGISDDAKFFCSAGENVAQFWDTVTLAPAGQPIRSGKGSSPLSCNVVQDRVVTKTDREFMVWDLRTGQQVGQPLPIPEEATTSVSPEGGWIAIRSPVELAFYSVKSMEKWAIKPVDNFGPYFSPGGDKAGVYFSPGGDKAGVVTGTNRLSFWDLKSHHQIGKTISAGLFRGAAISPDGQRYAILDPDELKVGTLIGGEQSSLKGGYFLTVSFSKDGKRVVISLPDEVQTWNPDDLRSVRFRPAKLMGSGYIGTGDVLLTPTTDGTVTVWNASTGSQVVEPIPSQPYAKLLASGRLATISHDGTFQVWRIEPRQADTHIGNPGFLGAVAFDAEGRKLVAHDPAGLNIWDTESGELSRRDLPQKFEPRSMVWSSFGTAAPSIVWSALGSLGSPSFLRIWEEKAGHAQERTVLLPGNVSDITLSPDTSRAAILVDNWLEFWDTRTQKKLGSSIPFRGQRLRPKFDPSGDHLLIVDSDDSLVLWESRAGRSPGKRLPHKDGVTAAQFSPDGHFLVTGTLGGTIHFWNGSTGTPLLRPLQILEEIVGIKLSRTGDTVLVNTDKMTYLVDLETGKIIGEPIPVASVPALCALNPDGRRVLVLSPNIGEGSIWDLRSGTLSVPKIELYGARAAEFSADGQRLWIAGNQVAVFDVPVFPSQETELLAELAEAVAGFRVVDGKLVPLKNQIDRLDQLRKETALAPLGKATAATLIRWFLADTKTRTTSPLSKVKARG